jgi:pimeloyl-ACP methyl ester carboxylesterase
MDPKPITFDVSDAVGEPARLAGSFFAAGGPAGDRPLLVCLPGGTYTRGYWDLHAPGHTGYSFARAAAGEGFPVVTLDSLGTGESTRPDRDIDLSDQGAAAASAVAQIPAVLGLDTPAVAVGHSMGGYVAMLQQAASASYAGLAILGTTNGAVGPLELPPELIAAAATTEGRAALIEQILPAFPDPYMTGDRAPLRSWFHLDDVPDDLIDVDDATTLTVVPRRCGAGSTVPGITADAAAAVEVPVLLAYGEVDVSVDPHAEPAFFRSSSDVTLYVLPRSGHCHNLAGTRHRLWDRLLWWCETAVTPTLG